MSAAKNVALVALGALGAAIAVNQLAKPSKTPGIANMMRRQLDDYNVNVQPVQDPNDTIFDRTKILNDVKAKKPWNMSYAEKERLRKSE
ncbi:hypothetical protein BDZ45DRAFT_594761 [Acephala macrosclerotiorum]|nr:hypothetical protein BDZ45DRAFT_594761 [Acephala macrosclerotiorum]